MMPTEVRIGNLIQCETKQNQYIVEGWHLKPDEDDDCEFLRHSIGILLTEQLLYKLGFEPRNKSRGLGAIYDFKKHKDFENKERAWAYSMSVAFVKVKDGELVYLTCLANPTAHRIIYVHQLQNLYFALTEQELIYTP